MFLRRIFCIISILFLTAGWCCPQTLSDDQVDSLVTLLHAESDVEERFLLLDKISEGCMSVDTTIKYAEMELALAEEAGSVRFKVHAIYFLGWSYYYIGDFSRSIELFKTALEIIDSSVEDFMVASCYEQMAYNYFLMGDFENAHITCRKAYQLFDHMDKPEKVSECFRLMSEICLQYQYYDLAIQNIGKALQIDTTHKGPVFSEAEAQDYMLLGSVDFCKYKYRSPVDSLIYSSLRYFEISDSLLKAINNDFGISELYVRIADGFLTLASNPGNDTETRDRYADTAISLAHLGMASAMKYGLDDNWLNLYMTETQCLIVKCQIDSVGDRLSFITSRYMYKPDHKGNFGKKFYQLSAAYNKLLGNYELALDFIDKERRYEFDRFNYDLASSITKIQAKENFDREMYELGAIKETRDRQFVESEVRSRKLNRLLSVIGIFFVALSVICAVGLVTFQRMSKTIRRQTMAIAEQNSELTAQHEEFMKLQDEYETERKSLERQKVKFRKANHNIITSFAHARQMQNVLIPSRTIMNGIFGDCLIYWKPLQTVSGDFYWATQIRDMRVLVTADCTGHGVPGAFMSMLGISSLNYIVSSRNVLSGRFSAAFVIEQMRSKVIKSLRQSLEDSEQYDSMDMSVVVYRTGETSIQYAGANRPLLIAGENGVREFQPDDMPAGLDFNNSNPFTNHVIDCRPGDVVYMYSDGITDQFGGRNGRTKFGDRRLRELLRSICQLPFSEQYLRVRECDTAWTTMHCPADGIEELYTPQLDDQLLIGVRIG